MLEMFCFGSAMAMHPNRHLEPWPAAALARTRGDSRESIFFARHFGKSLETQLFARSTSRLNINMPNHRVECRRCPAWRPAYAAAIRGGK
jgi:hypothetical protein